MPCSMYVRNHFAHAKADEPACAWFDAVFAHNQYSQDFTNDFLAMLEAEFGDSLFYVGEVFEYDVSVLTSWLDAMVRQ